MAGRMSKALARQFVRRVAEAPDEQLEALDGARARAIVTGIFRLMPTQFNRRAARDLRAAIEWRVTEADGGASIHTVRISGGRCRVRRGVVADPDLILSLDTADFLRLAAGVASAPVLFGEGRLRVQGDLGLALRLPRLFRVPRAQP